MTRDEFRHHVAKVLAKQGIVYTDEVSVDTIVTYWGCQEEFDPDFTDREIVHMYEVLGIGGPF
jgi:hypothetical protein